MRKLKERGLEKDANIMAAEVKHFAARIPNLLLKTNSCTFGECERNVARRVVLTQI